MGRRNEPPSEEAMASQRQLYRQAVARDTALLRTSAQPLWCRVRDRLEGEGADPADAVVASLLHDDNALEVGAILTRDGRAFAFHFDWLRDEAGNRLEYEDARVSYWDELELDDVAFPEFDLGREFLAGEQERNMGGNT